MKRSGGTPSADRRRSAIEAAFFSSERSLRRFIARLRPHQGDVDDIAQETLLRALSVWGGGEVDNPKAYLFRIARNLAMRAASRESQEILRYVDDLTVLEAPSRQPSAEERVIGREQLAALGEAIATLSPACRRVFVMRKIHGRSHKEIAERLGISTSTVEKHLATGLGRCVAYLRDDEPAGVTRPRSAKRS